MINGKIKGMQSLTELYKITRGPSSSHTMGAERICEFFKDEFKGADKFKVVLLGSLAKTGKGHKTDYIISRVFEGFEVEIVFDADTEDIPHPNTMDLYAYKENNELGYRRAISVGGGAIKIEGHTDKEKKSIYDLSSFADIADYCKKNNIKLWQYVELVEGKQIWDYLSEIWQTMKCCVTDGLKTEGRLPGGLDIQRKASYLFNQRHIDESAETKQNRLICAYAYAVSEQNADGGIVVTAPTCGAAGVLPSVLYYSQQKRGISDEEILRALASAGVIGLLIKTNASISGAECGCQAEIGSACSMAAAALAKLADFTLEQTEYAAEVAMEHHLGLTCDPVHGLVQIPCIERNAVAAMRAVNCVSLASFLSGTRKISFDLVVQTMYETGRDLCYRYRETSEGGLAKLYRPIDV